MKISAINSNSSKITTIKRNNNFRQNNNVTFTGYNLPRIPFLFSKPVSKTLSIPKEHLAKEMELSEIAIANNVNTPEISSNGEYSIHGEPANYKKNPIRPIHIKNMLSNIRNLDKARIFHGDIEKGHVYYSKDGAVQIDCFRFGSIMEEAEDRINWEFPQRIAPTNLYDFENNCLGDYLKQINDDEEEKEFIKQYLKISKDFHKKKAEDLKKAGASEEQIKFEELQAKLYTNPDDDIVRITRDRIKYKYIQREGYTEWDEGNNGACGHDKDEARAVKGVNLYFDAWKECVSQEIDIYSLFNRTEEKDKKEILYYLDSYTKHWDRNYTKSINGMANWTISPNNENNKSYRNLDRRVVNNFNYLYRKTSKTTNMSEFELLVETCKNYYNYMLARDEHL